MALFKPIKNTAANIANVAKVEGQFLFATDTGGAFVDIDNQNRVPLRGEAITEFTFVVDSDDALAAWANNTAGNNYTSVLIKKGTWTSSKEVNLTTAGTKVVVGQAGSLLSFTSSYGLRYSSTPTTSDYWMMGVSVECTSSGDGFYNCTNLTNCTGIGTYGCYHCANLTGCTGSGTSYGFYSCTNLTNCTGNGRSTSSGYGVGFYNCTNLTNCTGNGTGSGYDGYGFNNCRIMMSCKPSGSSTTGVYYACYMHASGTADAVGDTAAGGYNRS